MRYANGIIPCLLDQSKVFGIEPTLNKINTSLLVSSKNHSIPPNTTKAYANMLSSLGSQTEVSKKLIINNIPQIDLFISSNGYPYPPPYDNPYVNYYFGSSTYKNLLIIEITYYYNNVEYVFTANILLSLSSLGMGLSQVLTYSDDSGPLSSLGILKYFSNVNSYYQNNFDGFGTYQTNYPYKMVGFYAYSTYIGAVIDVLKCIKNDYIVTKIRSQILKHNSYISPPYNQTISGNSTYAGFSWGLVDSSLALNQPIDSGIGNPAVLPTRIINPCYMNYTVNPNVNDYNLTGAFLNINNSLNIHSVVNISSPSTGLLTS
jgi:hypothetical protein